MLIVYNPQLDVLGKIPVKSSGDIPPAKSGAFFNEAVRTGQNAIMSGRYGVAPELLKKVHSKAYVNGVLAGVIDNGYGNKDPLYLMHSLAGCGVMVEAVWQAAGGQPVVCAPVQGFHHAGWDSGYGYCTFNGLLLAVANLRERGDDIPVTIIDCDGHYGDGTDDILNHVDLGNVNVVSFEEHNYSESALRGVIINADRGLVIYQAGADSHIDDPYGVGYLTTEQMRRRDAVVFSTCDVAGHSVVWNLAGGYAGMESVLKLHLQTFEVCQQVWAR